MFANGEVWNNPSAPSGASTAAPFFEWAGLGMLIGSLELPGVAWSCLGLELLGVARGCLDLFGVARSRWVSLSLEVAWSCLGLHLRCLELLGVAWSCLDDGQITSSIISDNKCNYLLGGAGGLKKYELGELKK